MTGADDAWADGDHTALRARLVFLHRATQQIGAALDGEAAMQALCDVAVEGLADAAEVYLMDDASDAPPAPRRTATAKQAKDGDDAEQSEVRPPDPVMLASIIDGGQPVFIPTMDAEHALAWCEADDTGARTPWCAGHSLIAVPLVVRERVLGLAVFLRRPGNGPFVEADLLTGAQLAAQAGLAADNARLYQLQVRAADMLQRSMLPTGPPRLAGVEVAYRYLPASAEASVGGDWFDAIPLPGSRVALVVGDVMGHGLTSAAVMGQLRTAVQTLAALDLPPDQVLRDLDSLARRLGEHHMATCVYCVYDPVRHRCTVANAGHVPPVLVAPDGTARVLAPPSGAPVGVGGVAFEAIEFEASAGYVLALCTDGLIEARDRDLDTGLDALRGALSVTRPPLDELCDSVLRSLLADRQEDDAALLLARFQGIPSADVRHWILSSNPSTARQVRRLVRATLAEWDLTEHLDLVELLATELVTNAIRYATRPLQLRLLRTDVLLCEVTDDNHVLPVHRPAEPDDERGRGLNLVSALSQRWGASRVTGGKLVWFEIPLA